jgi:undecaprenyl-diphosphatase
VILFTGWRWWRILLLVVSASFVVLVGPSRIYLGDHWASDVLGSYLIGGVLLGMTLWIYLYLKREGVLQTERARKTTQRSKLMRSFPWK